MKEDLSEAVLDLLDRTFQSGTRVITPDDFSALTELSGIKGPPHTTDGWTVGRDRFSAPILPGPCVYACVVGLTGASGVLDALKTAGLVGLALVSVDSLKFRSPVMAGDELKVQARVTRISPARRVDEHYIGIEERALNQRDQLVLTAERTILAREGHADAEESG